MMEQPTPTRFARRDVGIAILIVLGVVLLYARTVTFDFIDFDDNIYVFDNPVVCKGLTTEGIRYAFTTGDTGNWHPITWLSHMVDVSLFGLSPGAHHATSVLLHALSGAMLFVFLRLATGRVIPAAMAAALFAWHPLRVESVAWIAERKDVLSVFFCLLTMLAWLAYVRSVRKRWIWYIAACITLALGLMSKSMLVTLPFGLLLLDIWPLNRLDRVRFAKDVGRLLVEKLPMFALVAAIAVITLRVQGDGGAVATLASISLTDRVLNAIVSSADYLRLTFVPTGLAIFYPHPYVAGGSGILPLKIAASAIVLLVVTFAAIRSHATCLALAVGWFWFLGTLVPVIGLVQVGLQGMADRYTYLPSIGLSIAIAWLIADVKLSLRPFFSAAAIAGVLALSVVTFVQVGYWRDQFTVMRRAADVVPNNYFAHINLGTIYNANGDLSSAEREYREAIRIVPNDPISNSNLGGFLVATGRAEEGFALLQRAVTADPAYAAAHLSLGDYYDQADDVPNAVDSYERGLALAPSRKEGWHHYALMLARRGNLSGASDRWKRAIAIDPNYTAALDGYGRLLLLTGDVAQGQQLLRRAVEQSPTAHATMYVLAWSLATSADPALRDPDESLRLGRHMVRLQPDNPAYVDALGAALAAAGRFPEAIEVTTHAAALARKSGMARAAEVMDVRIALYRQRTPYVQPAPATRPETR